MSIYKKLSEARLKLQAMELKKSGHNKFAGYNYFELGDFLPACNQIFSEVGLCEVTSFTAETATMTIHEIDGDGTIKITSPMGSAQLKGCHEVQNIGAVETYQRRYLWVVAMGIVEHDALDASNPKDAPALVDAKQVEAIELLLADVGMTVETFCKTSRISSLGNLPASKFDAAIKWLEGQKND